MTLSIISQDGVVYNYSNAVSRLVTGESDDGRTFGFMVFLNDDSENFIVVAEYNDETKFNAVREDFMKWLRDSIDATFVFPL